jgi:hypothetical protein
MEPMLITYQHQTVPPPSGDVDLSACIGLYPKPGCGTEPQNSGDRGGSMQIALFGILIAALAVIGVRIARSIIARDRAIDASLKSND